MRPAGKGPYYSVAVRKGTVIIETNPYALFYIVPERFQHKRWLLISRSSHKILVQVKSIALAGNASRSRVYSDRLANPLLENHHRRLLEVGIVVMSLRGWGLRHCDSPFINVGV